MKLQIPSIRFHTSSRTISQNTKSKIQNPFNRLSDDLIRYIFSFVGVRYTGVLSIVCKRWRILCNQDLTWSMLLSVPTNELHNMQPLINKYKSDSNQYTQRLSQLVSASALVLKKNERLSSLVSGRDIPSNICIDNNKLVFSVGDKYYEIFVYDFLTDKIINLGDTFGKIFIVSKGIVYHLDFKVRKLGAYDCGSEKNLWEYQCKHSYPDSIFVDKRNNRLYMCGNLSFLEQSIHAFDLTSGDVIYRRIFNREQFNFMTICGDYAYFMKGDYDSKLDCITVYAICLSSTKAEFITLFAKNKSEEMLSVIGAVEENKHILCSRHMLAVLKLSSQESAFIFNYTLPQHLTYVYRISNELVYMLLENILCIHAYDSLINEYSLQFWDMNSCTMIKTYNVPFELKYIFTNGLNLIAFAQDGAYFSIEYERDVEELNTKMNKCSIM